MAAKVLVILVLTDSLVEVTLDPPRDELVQAVIIVGTIIEEVAMIIVIVEGVEPKQEN